MNRTEFIKRLEELLQDIPAEEREEAVQYYQNYFDDAGPEHETEIIQELESPEKVAATIKAGMEGMTGENGEYTENGYRDERFENRETLSKSGYHQDEQRTQSGDSRNESSKDREAAGEYTEGAYQYHETSDEKDKPRTSRLLKILLIIAIIFVGAPIVLPFGLGGIGVLIGLFFALVGLSFGLVIGSVAIFVSGVVLLIAGIMKLASIVSAGIFTMGAGLLMIALGMAATVVTVKLCLIVYPALFRGTVNLFRRLLYGKEEV